MIFAFFPLVFLLITDGSRTWAAPGNYAGKIILYVDSYHQGYAWSNGIADGIRMMLHGTNAEIQSFHMDTKRHNDENYIKDAALRAKSLIERLKPDVVIASDDNASKYLIMPYYKDAETPFVFCGVNWDEKVYGYPYSNVTGVVEVDLVRQMVDTLKRYAKGDRIGYISADAPTERKIVEIYNKLFFKGKMKSYFASSVAELKQLFLKAQKENDQLYFSNNAGLPDWNEKEAKTFFQANTTIPTGSHNAWMADYVLYTVAKLPEEQGMVAAKMALRILDGASPSSISIVNNRLSSLVINMKIGRNIGVVLELKQLSKAQIIR